MINFNHNNMRCKKLHWMTESVWKWHIIFTDCMSTLCPTYARVQVFGYTNLGLANTKATAANRRSACSQIHMPSDKL